MGLKTFYYTLIEALNYLCISVSIQTYKYNLIIARCVRTYNFNIDLTLDTTKQMIEIIFPLHRLQYWDVCAIFERRPTNAV